MPRQQLNPHSFYGNTPCAPRVEVFDGFGWIERRFPLGSDGLRAALDYFEAVRFDLESGARSGKGVALWLGPSLCACLMSAEVQQAHDFHGPGETIDTTAEELDDG